MSKVITILSLLVVIGCNPLNKASHSEISIAGTKWKFIHDDSRQELVVFNNDGTIESKDPNNHAWKQTGTDIYFQFNAGFAKYSGKLISPNIMKGKAVGNCNKWERNPEGNSWGRDSQGRPLKSVNFNTGKAIVDCNEWNWTLKRIR